MTTRQRKIRERLIEEIYNCIAPKKFNYLNGTQHEAEYQRMSEANAFLSLIQYSALPIEEIARIWDDTGLKYQ